MWTQSILALAILLSIQTLSAQPHHFFGDLEDQDLFTDMIPSESGGVYVIGSFDDKVLIAELNENMEMIWSNAIAVSASNQIDMPTKIISAGVGINSGFIVAGYTYPKSFSPDGFGFVLRISSLGELLWKKEYTTFSRIFDITKFMGGFALVGEYDPAGTTIIGRAMKISINGTEQWTVEVDVYKKTSIKRAFLINNEKILLVGRTGVIGTGPEGVFLRMVDSSGNTIWETFADFSWYDDWFFSTYNEEHYLQNLAATLEGDNLWIANPSGHSNENIRILQYDLSDGIASIQSTQTISTPFMEIPTKMNLLPDGNFIIAGYASNKDGNLRGFARKIHVNGLPLWERYYDPNDDSDRLNAIIGLENGKLVMAGSSKQTNLPSDGWLMTAQANGNIKPWKIEGKVLFDSNGNCAEDAMDLPALGWILRSHDTLSGQFVTTNSEGEFSLYVDQEVTQLEISLPPQSNWSVCSSSLEIITNENNPVNQAIFFVQDGNPECKDVQVHISQPDLVRCESSRLPITVRNNSLEFLMDEQVKISLDPHLEVVDASTSYTQLGADLIFDIPHLPPVKEYSFYLDVSLDCNVQLGATHQVSASLMTNHCDYNWQGAVFGIEGVCEDGLVKFFLENIGLSNVAGTAQYNIFGNGLLIAENQTVDLAVGGAPHEIKLPADGRTWQIVIDQPSAYPGEHQISKVIEACGLADNGLHAVGNAGLHPTWSNKNYHDLVFLPNTLGYENVIEIEHPGYGFYNLTPELHPIDFTIRLSNPLNVQVDKLDIRLLISNTLDPTTFQILGGNVIPKFTKLSNGFHLSATDIVLQEGEVAHIKCRIHPFPDTPVDAQAESNFLLSGIAYFNNGHPILIGYDFLNHTDLWPITEDPYYDYQPEIRQYGGRSYEFAETVSISKNKEVFLGGSTYSYSPQGQKGYLIKADQNGKAFWETIIHFENIAHTSIHGIVPRDDGSCFIAGNATFPGITTNYLSDNQTFYALIDNGGKVQWVRFSRPFGEQYYANVNGFLPTADGGGIIFGYSRNADGAGSDPFYIRIDKNGEEAWINAQEINGSAFRPVSGTLLPDGSAVFCGTNNSTVIDADTHVQQITSNGDFGFSSSYNSANGANIEDITLSPDSSGILVAGYSSWYYEPEEYGVTPTFIKFSKTGEFLWEKNTVVAQDHVNASVKAVAPSDNGGFYFSGEIYTDNISSFDMLVGEIDEFGDLLWHQNIGTSNSEQVIAMDKFSNGNLALFGYNQRRPPSYNLESLYTVVDGEGHLVTNTREPIVVPNSKILLFPNPANVKCQIALSPVPNKIISYRLFDVNGREIISGNTDSQGRATISIDGLSNGMYFLSMSDKNYKAKPLIVLR